MSLSWCTQQLDYLWLLGGLAHFLVAAGMWRALPSAARRGPWLWFGLYALLTGAAEWLELLAWSTGDAPTFQVCRQAVQAVAFAALASFAGQCARRGAPLAWGRWGLGLIVLVLATMVLWLGLRGVGVGTHGVLGVPATLAAAVILWRGHAGEDLTRRAARLAAVLLGGLAVLELFLALAAADRFGPWWDVMATGVPGAVVLQLDRLVLVSGLALLAWHGRSWSRPPERRPREGLRWALSLALLVLAGWLGAELLGRRADVEERSLLLSQVRTAAAGLSTTRIGALTGTAADPGSAPYEGLKQQLVRLWAANPRARLLYVLAARGDQVIFLVDSEAPDSADYSPPGDALDDPTPALRRLLRDGGELVEGPVTDRLGTWISALVAVPSPFSSRPLAALGMDVDYRHWQHLVARARLGPIVVVLLLAVLLILLRMAQEHDAAVTAALRAGEERWRSLVHTAPDIIYSVDRQGRILSINRTPAGMDPQAVIGQDAVSFVAPEWQALVRAKIEAVFSSGLPGNYEVVAKGDHGQPAWYATSLGPVLDGDQVVALTLVTRDVTARHLAEEALRQANQRLEAALVRLQETQQQVVEQERLRALGQMASGIAHDFNNQLMVIMGMTELLLLRVTQRGEAAALRPQLEAIRTATTDAAKVVERLREFYRHRDASDHLVAVDLNTLVREVANLTAPHWQAQAQATGRRIALDVRLGRVPPVLGNAAELRTALANLVLNAVDALPHGGHITLTTCRREEQVAVEVADDGEGMSAEVQQRCLEPFFTTKGPKGSGLGLSVVHGIIRRHGGTLGIASGIGTGTCVCLTLPAAAPSSLTPAAAPPTTASLAAAPAASRRIVLVEDEAAVRQVVAGILSAAGHQVTSFAGGEAACAQLGPGVADLVITDHAMPGMSGEQLAARLHVVIPEVPIILLTGFGAMMQAAGEQPAGVARVLGKPINAAVLLAVVNEVLASPTA